MKLLLMIAVIGYARCRRLEVHQYGGWFHFVGNIVTQPMGPAQQFKMREENNDT